MEVKPNPDLQDELMHLLREKYPRRRDARPHVTSLIRPLDESFASYKSDEELDERTLLTFIRGNALHELLAVGAQETEIELDGIYAHIDEQIPASPRFPVAAWLEKKTGNMSSNNAQGLDVINVKEGDGKKFYARGYIRQMMAYAVMLEQTFMDMVILHLQGDYKDRRPILTVNRWMFTEQELHRFWAHMLVRRDIWNYMIVADKPLSELDPSYKEVWSDVE